MKKIILFLALTAIYSTSFSQTTESSEAEKNLTKASENLKAKKYQDALLSIVKVKEEIVKLITDQLVLALPKTIDGWNQNPSTSQGVGTLMSMTPGEISTSRTFSSPSLIKTSLAATNTIKSTPTGTGVDNSSRILAPIDTPEMHVVSEDPSIRVTITNNALWANEVTSAHTIVTNENQAPTAYSMVAMEGAIKVSEFRALERFNSNMKSGSVTVIAGAGVIKVDGNNIDNKDILLKFANAIDYKLVKSVLGE